MVRYVSPASLGYVLGNVCSEERRRGDGHSIAIALNCTYIYIHKYDMIWIHNIYTYIHTYTHAYQPLHSTVGSPTIQIASLCRFLSAYEIDSQYKDFSTKRPVRTFMYKFLKSNLLNISSPYNTVLWKGFNTYCYNCVFSTYHYIMHYLVHGSVNWDYVRLRYLFGRPWARYDLTLEAHVNLSAVLLQHIK